MATSQFQRRQYETLAASFRTARGQVPASDLAGQSALNKSMDALINRLRADNTAFDSYRFRITADYGFEVQQRVYAADEKKFAAEERRLSARAKRKPRPQMTDGLTSDVLVKVIRDLSRSKRTNAGILAMKPRRAEFGSGPEMLLAGIAMLPESRAALDQRLDDAWAAYRRNFFGSFRSAARIPEVIIGAGVHAAAYAAARTAAGFPKPLVLERSGRVGGAFAVSRAPSFYLNSRNRPGLPGLPNRGQALNVILGAPVQMAALSGLQFQPNTDMAYVVRCTLAEHADVLVNAEVQSVTQVSGGYDLYLGDGYLIRAGRVIDARGLGDAGAAGVADGKRILTFQQFASRMDDAFPFKGMRRIAVIGGGDSGKCVLEAAMGSGPDGSRIVTALDYVESADIYAPGLPQTCDAWRSSQRGRYQDIGGYLPATVTATVTGEFDRNGNRLYKAAAPGKPARINVFNTRAACTPTTGAVLVGTNTYDMAVLATGSELKDLTGGPARWVNVRPAGDDSEPLAVQDRFGTEYYRVGPAAKMAFSRAEEASGISAIPANAVAMFRLTPRTAALATSLTAPDIY